MLQYACQQFATATDLLNDEKCACELDAGVDGALIEAVLDMASDALYMLSDGRVTGVCARTVRPVGEGWCPPIGFWASVYGDAPYFGTLHGKNVIPLRGPRVDVVEVLVDGVALTAGEYGLIDDVYLYRVDGSWPSASDPTDANPFEVTYRFGWPPDFVTKQAAIELACELAKDALGKSSRLPQGTTSANIQGAAVAIRDIADDDAEGLARVARFLSLYVPRERERSGVWSPELGMGWRLAQAEGPSGS